MGQDQSSSMPSSSSASLPSFLSKGMSPRPVRIPKQVVVVKTGQEGEPMPDEDLVKLQEIPQFLPILRGSLNIPELKDPPDLGTKFDYRPAYAIFHRLQDHLAAAADVVAGEQASLSGRIREVDYAVATMSNYLTERQKNLGRAVTDFNVIKEINGQLIKITSVLQEVVPASNELRDAINAMLPADEEKLPQLTFNAILNNDAKEPADIDEQKVVDKT